VRIAGRLIKRRERDTDSFPSEMVAPRRPPRRFAIPMLLAAIAPLILALPTTAKRTTTALSKRTDRDMLMPCLGCQSLSLVSIPTPPPEKAKMLIAVIDKISRDRMKALGAAMHSVQKLRAWCHDNVFAGKLCINPSSQEQDETEMCELTIFGFIGVRLARAGLKSRWGPPFEGHSVDILLSTLDMPVMALTGCHDQCKAQADRAVADFFNEVQDIANGVVGFDLLPESAGAAPESWSSTQRTSNGAGYAAGTKRAGATLFPDSFKRVAM
jgi:hypothetical protein